MKRRAFITLLGGAAAAWPVVARGQQPGRMRRIGALVGSAADDPVWQTRNAAFLQSLKELGWTVGHNMQIDYRWAAGGGDRFRKYAAELVALKPDVILATSGPAVAALQRQTQGVPIVFLAVVDPVGAGFVNSLARPGGNATGFMQSEYSLSGKWLELLKEVAPNLTQAAVLRDAAITAGIGQFAVIQAAGPSLRVEVRSIGVREAIEIERASRHSRAPRMAASS